MRWMIGGFLLLFGLTTGEAAPPDHSADAGKMVVAGITAQAERTSFYSPGAPLVIGLAANVTIPGKAVAAGSSLGGVEIPDQASSADLGALSAPDACPAVIVDAFGGNAAAACRVSWCESRWRTTVVGDAGELGPFQVHPVHHSYLYATFGPEADIAGWDINVWYAYRLSRGGSDWSHWSCKP